MNFHENYLTRRPVFMNFSLCPFDKTRYLPEVNVGRKDIR